MADLTILIPTYERQHTLEKLVNYWSNTSFKIFILDGSKEKVKNNILNTYPNIEYLHFRKQIEDKECPQGSYYRRLCQGFNKVETKYTLIATDDDLFNIRAIEECLIALGKKDYFNSFSGFNYSCVFKKNTITLKREYKNSSFLTSGIKDPDIRASSFFYNYEPRYYYSISNTELSKSIFEILYRYQFLPIFAWGELFFEISMSLISCHNIVNLPFSIRGVNTKIKRFKKVKHINDCFFEKEISNHLDHLITDLSKLLINYSDKSLSEIQNYFKFSIIAFISYSEIKEIKTINSEIKNKLKNKFKLNKIKNYFYRKQNEKYADIYNKLNYDQIEILFSKLKIDL